MSEKCQEETHALQQTATQFTYLIGRKAEDRERIGTTTISNGLFAIIDDIFWNDLWIEAEKHWVGRIDSDLHPMDVG
jgi:hypothetical protein